MSTKLLADIGEALYGERWQSDLASALGVNRRTIARWVSGKFDPPDAVWDDLRVLLDARGRAIGALVHRLKRAA